MSSSLSRSTFGPVASRSSGSGRHLPEPLRVYPVDVGYEHVVELPSDPVDLHPQRNFRQHRNQARAKGVQVSRGSGAPEMAGFYRLHTLTRRRLGVPVQPRRFFNLLRNRLLEPGGGFVATAKLDGEVLAAAVYLVHNATIVAKYQASDPSRRETGAGHLMHWEVMSEACAEGYHAYDLGRTDLDTEGLRVFKTRMGAVETPLVHTYRAQTAQWQTTERGQLASAGHPQFTDLGLPRARGGLLPLDSVNRASHGEFIA